MKLFLFSLCVATNLSTFAHEWSKPHTDEYLNINEAEALGFEFQIEPIRNKGRLAVSTSVTYPTMITGESLNAGDINEGCGTLESNIDSETIEGDVLIFSRYEVTLVTTPECEGSAIYWAKYGSSTFYYLNLDDNKELQQVNAE